MNLPVQSALLAVADRIRERHARVTADMIGIGQDLAEARAMVPRGAFIAWVERDVGITPRLAQMYMRAAEWAADNTKLISHLKPTAVLKLAAKATPAEVVQQVETQIARGEPVSVADVDKFLCEARRAKQSADKTEWDTEREMAAAMASIARREGRVARKRDADAALCDFFSAWADIPENRRREALVAIEADSYFEELVR